MGVIVFVLAATAVMVLLHRYIWRRLVRAPDWPKRWSRAATRLLWALGLTLPAGFLLGRFLPREQVWVLSAVCYLWLGLLFYMVVIRLLWDVGLLLPRLLRACIRVAGKLEKSRDQSRRAPAPLTPEQALFRDSRRSFLLRAAAGSTAIASLGVAAWGTRCALWEIETPEVEVRLPRLPRALSGFRLAMLCDLHLGPLLGRDFVEAVVEKTNQLRADATVIVGDMVDGSVAMLGPDVEPMGRLRARQGVFFVTGNHEYYSGVDEWLAFLPGLGVRVLANQRVSLGDSTPGGRSFDLAGIPDLHAGRYHPAAPDLGRAVAGRDPERELVVLAHQPVQVHDADAAGAGLMLAGHTHGGQLFPFGGLTRLVQPYLSGLHRHSELTNIYVSCGTGFWGPPMRVLAPAEITLLVLTSS